MADRRVQMALGDFRFEMGRSDFETAQHRLAWRWAKQEVIGQYPVHQFVGEGVRSLQLSGAVFGVHSGLSVMEALKAAASQKQPLRLADEFGHFLGYWLIERLQLDDAQLLESKPLQQRYQLNLIYFGERL